MKKRLEAELISIAHRVLKLKNKSEVDQLFIETQKLYEALSVLKFYGDHIEQVKSEISSSELEEKLADALENKSAAPTPIEDKAAEVSQLVPTMEESEVTETKVVAVEHESETIASSESEESEEEPIEETVNETAQLVPTMEESEVTETKVVAVEHTSETIEASETEESEATPEEEPIIVGEITIDEEDDIEAAPIVEAKEEINSDPIFEMASEEIIEKKEPVKSETKQISFEDFLGDNYKDVEFVKPNETSKTTTPKAEILEDVAEVLTEKKEEKKTVLNEKLATGINIGLNDRIGFVKYLFDNSSEDFNRVLSQLNTFDSYAEAKEFIDDMVKPDYNNWQGNEDYAERFMEIVEQKFN